MMKKVLLAGIMVASIVALVYAGDIRYLGTRPCTEKIVARSANAHIFRLCDGQTKVIIEVSGLEPGGGSLGPRPRGWPRS